MLIYSKDTLIALNRDGQCLFGWAYNYIFEMPLKKKLVYANIYFNMTT